MRDSIVSVGQAHHPKANCPNNAQVSCADCRLSGVCLPISLHMQDIDKLDEIIQRGFPLQSGDALYQAGGEFRSVYAVRSGAIKAVTLARDGQEQVTGFYLPGEIVGIDGIANSRYTNTAVALETSSVCEIPFHSLEELSLQIPHLQRHLFQLLGKEIVEEQQLLTLLSKHTAEERVAAFLVSLSSRHHRRNLSATQFRLPMSRADIGNFLGLTVETVSRTLRKLQNQSLVTVDKKEIEITDLSRLSTMANACE